MATSVILVHNHPSDSSSSPMMTSYVKLAKEASGESFNGIDLIGSFNCLSFRLFEATARRQTDIKTCVYSTGFTIIDDIVESVLSFWGRFSKRNSDAIEHQDK